MKECPLIRLTCCFLLLLVILLAGGIRLEAQSPLSKEKVALINRHVARWPEAVGPDLRQLVAFLAEPCTTDQEIAWACFRWITTNIRYDDEALRAEQWRINRTIGDILNRRRAICFGYALLFREMCAEAGITAELISGYSKGSLTSRPSLEAPDHAWNAVRLDGNWFLLDATWGAGAVHREQVPDQRYPEDYFLADPASFVRNHLPTAPMWQLLDCPVPLEMFARSAGQIGQYLDTVVSCSFNYRDSLDSFSGLSHTGRRVYTAEVAYQLNPTDRNARELTATLIDYAGELGEREEVLMRSDSIGELLALQAQILDLYGKAAAGSPLYDWQTENRGYAHLNHAVAWSRLLDAAREARDIPETIRIYETMIVHLERSIEILESLQPSVFTEQALKQAKDYLAWAKANLAAHQKPGK